MTDLRQRDVEHALLSLGLFLLNIIFFSLALSTLLLGTAVALAEGGDQDDPLVTLSYLNQTAIPQIVKQVEEKTDARRSWSRPFPIC